MTRLPLEYLRWAEKTTATEHVSLRSFVKHFDLSDRVSATKAYGELIEADVIRQKRRIALKTSFIHFRKHYEERFWTKRVLEVRTEEVANRTGLIVHEVGEVQSKAVFDNFLSKTHSELDSGPHDGVTNSVMNYSFVPPPSTPTVLKRGRTSRNVVPSKVARHATSKTKIKEPWHSLIEAALLLHDGWQVDLPEVDTDFKQESTRRSTLYRLALHHLHNAKTLQAQSHFDRTRCLDYKDAFVAFSGIWNTYSSTANEFFGQSLTVEAKTLCYMQSIDDKDQVLMEIVDGLLQKQTLDEILDETYHLQVSQPTYRRLLDVLRIIIRNIIRPLHGSKAPSEADCLALWSSIFQEGLPLNSRLSMHLGEQGCCASALSKSKLADVFETGTMPRKCDGLLSVDSVEVGNFECKRAGASRQEVACQLRKNIKINKSILLELDKYELECPLLLSIHGMSAIVFRIRWHDIWVAGKASSTIVLPSTFDELRLFLGNPTHRLANLLNHYHEYAAQAHRAYQEYQYQKKGEDEEDAVSSTPKNVTETLEWEQVVFHTPTKVARRPSLLDKLKRTQEGMEEGWSEDEVEN